MLGGIAPIILFRFGELPTATLVEAKPILEEISFDITKLGLPIPIYLDRKLTGILVENETKNIDLETEAFTREVKEGPKIRQKGINSTVTINLVANRSAIISSVLLFLLDMIFPRISTLKYSVSYFNGNTIIIDGLLHGVAIQSGNDDDLIRISLTISKAAERVVTEDKPTAVSSTLGPTSGVAGLLGGG
jgi:cobalamin biosynthesis protein CbiG